MARAEIECMIRDAYTARRDEDVEAVLSLFTADATYRISVNERLGDYGRTVRGQGELRPFFEALFGQWDWRDFRIEQILIDESGRPVRAAVYSTGRIRHTPTGEEFDFETLDLLALEGGKIASFLEFFDTDLLARFTARA